MYNERIHDNGLGLSESESKVLNDRAKSQEAKILDFLAVKRIEVTAEDVQRMVLPACPITSVRRALTNLMNKGFIEKLETKKKGRYDVNIHLYKIAGKQLRMF